MIGSIRTRTGVAAAALALSSAALLGACGSSAGSDPADAPATTGATSTTAVDTSETTSTPDTESTTTAAEGGEPTTTLSNEGVDSETTELDTLPDGDHYGYMAGLESGKVEGQDVQVIIWDEVEFLTGQEAIDAAAEDNVTLDTDYYIRNNNQTVRRLAVVPEASVTTLQEGSSGSRPSSVDEVWQQEHLFKINVGNVRDITTISSIDGVYLP
ncbi:hypothetical protein ACE2AJ_15765 [Aquihabitans daechungensis]|uniref:hypothetical protein n=1 Tax=Aquihabitans daechungensis TaxID=1052257 RepID=UPI003BA39EE4